MTPAPVVVAARRTPIGTVGRAFASVPAYELAASVLRALCGEIAGLTPAISPQGAVRGDVGRAPQDVVLGNCMGPGGNLARVAALAAGLGDAVPGVTIDRQCGSGLAAILLAGQAIRAGDATYVLAGGVESASTAPRRIDAGRPYTRAPFAPPGHADPEMGAAADALAARSGITRERQDAYALASHTRALGTDFTGELVAVDARAADHGGMAADHGGMAAGARHAGRLLADQHPRRLTAERLARLRPAFVPGGTVTAGNSSPISDGAAAVAMVADGRPGLRLVAGTVTGCDPALPGWGPVPAVRAVCARAGISPSDVDAVEIVEAFAGQVLAVTDALELDLARVCAGGGAIALGHPWGATGAVAVVRLFSRLVVGGAPAGTLGLATAAVGGGLGVAALFETVR